MLIRNKMIALMFASAIMAACMALTGCYSVALPREASAGQLLTVGRTSAIEYSLYANKQVQVFVSAINARQLAITISKNENEKEAAETAKREMEEALNEFRQVNPSIGMEDMQADTVRCMENAINHMEGYIGSLSSGESTYPYKDIFSGDIMDLTAMAELYNQ